MGITVIIHIAAGTVGLVTGYAALAAAKGGPTHRAVGLVFVYAMVTMGLLGSVMAATQAASRPGVGLQMTAVIGALTAYLVYTSLATMRPAARVSPTLQALLGGTLAAAFLGFALAAMVSPQGTHDGMPPVIYLIFGLFATLGFIGDVKVVRHGERRGAARTSRHLWRMCIALLIASFSFFVGQAQVLPEALRVPFLLALPEIVVVGSMFFWLWRTWRGGRITRAARRTTATAHALGASATS